jgi:hypothetical protein
VHKYLPSPSQKFLFSHLSLHTLLTSHCLTTKLHKLSEQCLQPNSQPELRISLPSSRIYKSWKLPPPFSPAINQLLCRSPLISPATNQQPCRLPFLSAATNQLLCRFPPKNHRELGSPLSPPRPPAATLGLIRLVSLSESEDSFGKTERPKPSSVMPPSFPPGFMISMNPSIPQQTSSALPNGSTPSLSSMVGMTTKTSSSLS